MSNLAAQPLDEAVLAERRGHDVGHHVVAGHRVDDVLRAVPGAQHAVSAVVVQHRSMSGHDPRTASGQRHVRIDGRGGVEVDETGLEVTNEVALVSEHRAFTEFFHQDFETLLGFIDRPDQALVRLEEPRDRCIVEPGGSAGPLPGTERMKTLEGIVLHGRDGHRTSHHRSNP